uniref:Outer membrane protein assembly factor BamA n=1 Tax=Solibacter usitatus (strain Ellin6076) TaxID=234267 RepID=Q02B19_SOLUE
MNLVRSLLAYSFYMIVLLAASPWRVCGQAQKFEGMTVANIRFEPREQPLEGSYLFEILPLKRGEPLRASVVRASIERLFATGQYLDIKVSAEPYNGGVIVTFITTNSWFIGDVSVAGRVSDPPNRGQLVNATRLDLGEPYTENALNVAIAAQKRLLEGNGLYLSSISPTFDYDTEHQQINIRFRIDSGARARFFRPVLLGDYKLDPARILTATRFRRWLIHTWKPVTQTRMRQGLDGVRSLYQRENRLEAKVQLESVRFDPGTMRLVPTLNINAGPRIEVSTVGAKLSQSKLRRYVPIFEEHAVDQDLLLEGARNLRDYYQSQGFFEAQVEVVPQKVINDKADVTYLVNTGKRHRLVSIVIKGNKYFTTDVIRERMYLQIARRLQFPHGRFSENLLRRDRDTIINLYESNGFRDVKVTSRVVDDDKGKVGDIAVTINIDEGPQYLVNHVEIIGMQKLDQSRIMNKLSSVEGQPFSEFNVAVDRDTILAQYFDNGFPRATFEWSSKPAAEPHRVDLVFTIQENEQQFVRAVVVTGLKITNPSLVSRNLLLNPGDPLSPTAMTNTQRRLYELGVFAKVDAAIQNPEGATTRKFVLFNMEEAARYSMAFGVGAELGRIGGCQTCLDAPAGTTGFSPRVSWDVTRNNIWGLGHSLTLSTRASTLEKRALLAYNWPRFQGNDRLTLTLTALYLDSRDVRTFTSKREEVSMQLFQRLTKASTLFYRYSYRRVSVDEATLKISPLLINLLSQPVRVGILSVGWVLDRRDDPVDPHKGVYNTIDIGVAEHMIGSDVNFARFLLRNATYHPIGKRLVLARSTQIGDIYAFHPNGDALNAIPLPERFYGGGGTSNRGFPENQAGPRDLSTGFPVGGTALLFNQTEMRFPLIGDNIGGVLFHDVGNIYTTAGAFSLRQTQRSIQDFNYMVHAVGIGVRYRTPVGPLRVDLGYSINPPTFFGFKGTQQDLLNAGVNPCLNSPQCVVQNISHFQYFFSIGQTF